MLVKQLRSPTERPRDEAARRLVRALTASDVDDMTLSRAADRIMEVYLSAQGRSSSTAEKIILSAVDECLRAITTRRPHDRETLHRHATCLHLLGHSHKDQGDLERALDAYREVEDIDHRLQSDGTAAAEDGTGVSLSIGDVLLSQGALDEALAQYRDPSNAGSDEALGRIGTILQLQGDFDGALAAMQDYTSLLHQQVEQNPRDSVTRFHLGLAYSAIGSTFADKGDVEDGLQAYAAAMELISQTAIHNPMDPYVQSEWGVMHLRTARALRASGESAAALQYVQRGSAIMHRVVEMHDDKPHYWRYFALFELEWGDLCRQQCDMEEATAHLGTARAVFERLVAHDPSNVEWQADSLPR